MRLVLEWQVNNLQLILTKLKKVNYSNLKKKKFQIEALIKIFGRYKRKNLRSLKIQIFLKRKKYLQNKIKKFQLPKLLLELKKIP